MQILAAIDIAASEAGSRLAEAMATSFEPPARQEFEVEAEEFAKFLSFTVDKPHRDLESKARALTAATSSCKISNGTSLHTVPSTVSLAHTLERRRVVD